MMPLPYSDVFSVFPEILRAKNRDLKTSHDTYWGCHMHFFFRQPLWKQLCTYSPNMDLLYRLWLTGFIFWVVMVFLLYINFFYLYVLKHFEYVTYLLICNMVRIF